MASPIKRRGVTCGARRSIRAGWSTIGCGWRSTRAARFCRSGARQKLALVEPELPSSADAPLRLRFPGAKALEVPVVRDGPSTRVRVWDDHRDGIDQGDAAANWLSAVLEVEGARLVRMKEGARRPCDARYAPRGSLTAYSDGFPLLASEMSLGALNERIAARGRGKKVPMWFRPNLIVGDRFEIATTGRAALVAGSRPLRRMGGRHPRGRRRAVSRAGLRRRQALRALQDPNHRSEDGRARRPAAAAPTSATTKAAGRRRRPSRRRRCARSARARSSATARRGGPRTSSRRTSRSPPPPGGVVAVGDVVVATPRRRPSLAWACAASTTREYALIYERDIRTQTILGHIHDDGGRASVRSPAAHGPSLHGE